MFEHHRMEEALAHFQAFREAVESIATREEFSSLGGEGFVQKAREGQLPEWESKYTEKVLAAKCAELARGIATAVGSARNLFEHHNDEGFLEALRDAENKMSAVIPPQQEKESTYVLLFFLMQHSYILFSFFPVEARAKPLSSTRCQQCRKR